MTPLCVVCGCVCPDPGLWVIRGGEACSERCARGRACDTVTARWMLQVIDDHYECVPCFLEAAS